MSGLGDAISVTPIYPFGSAEPVGWNAVCHPCQEARSFDDEAALNIWISSHEERHGDAPTEN